jgi:hypothetical protein
MESRAALAATSEAGALGTRLVSLVVFNFNFAFFKFNFAVFDFVRR